MSKGSIFNTTHCTSTRPTDKASASTMLANSSQRLRLLASSGASTRWNRRCTRVGASAAGASAATVACGWGACISRRASHGVTVNATPSEMAMPRLALIGIGPM